MIVVQCKFLELIQLNVQVTCEHQFLFTWLLSIIHCALFDLKDLGWVSNTISNMENISKSPLETLKHITNHSAQKSGKKIKTKYVLKSEIISLTGHRAEAGFNQKIRKINLFFTFKAINFDRRSPIFYIALQKAIYDL